ncbi:MAG: hypothetical protein C0459_03465 [Chitinophaga sp.]|jgi:hypothetical protein|nr:hypothetical protein [Chitinophaga sp.]
MARTIDEIYNSLLIEKANHAELNALNSVSRVAMWKLYFYVVSVFQWVNEKMWDAFALSVDDKIANQTVGKREWYRQLALNFQYGYNLTSDGKYDNSNLTQAQIDDSKIIKYCSVTETSDGKLRMKVAKQLDNKPIQLNDGELAAFSVYIDKLKFDGVKILKESHAADNLKLTIDIWYDSLVIKSDGSRIDGSSATPVKDGIINYLNNLDYNGEYSNTKLQDALQQVTGVKLCTIKLSQSKYGLYPFVNIDEKIVADAGFFVVNDADLIINYRQYV